MNCSFFDSAAVTTSSEVGGIHLDKQQHNILGKTIAKQIQTIVT